MRVFQELSLNIVKAKSVFKAWIFIAQQEMSRSTFNKNIAELGGGCDAAASADSPSRITGSLKATEPSFMLLTLSYFFYPQV